MTTIDTGIRVALREITENAYRALRVVGASHGEAQATAESVQFAEVRDGAGIRALMSTLEAGYWHPSGLMAVPSTREGVPFIEVEPGARRGATVVGPMLIELAAGRREPVVYPRALELSSVVDLALLRNAYHGGGALIIAAQEGSRVRLRCATADGVLGHGEISSVVTDAVTTVIPQLAPGLTCVAPVPSLPEGLAQPMVWESATDQNQRRQAAARDGLTVEAETWSVLRDAASGYLLPETA